MGKIHGHHYTTSGQQQGKPARRASCPGRSVWCRSKPTCLGVSLAATPVPQGRQALPERSGRVVRCGLGPPGESGRALLSKTAHPWCPVCPRRAATLTRPASPTC